MTVESPSLLRETGAVIRAVFHIVIWTAALMGASQTATRSRIFFARRELRKLLGADPRLSAHVQALLESGGAR